MLPRYSDSHFHMYTQPEVVRAYIERMRAHGMERLGLMTLTCTGGKLKAENNIVSLRTKLACGDFPLYAFGGVCHNDYFSDVPFEKQAEVMRAIGFDGMKFLEMKPNMHKLVGGGLNAPEYYRLFEYLEHTQTPVVMHCADPETFWDKSAMLPSEIERGWWYGDGTFPSYRQIYDEVFEILDRHPNLNVVLAHFFFLSNYYDEAVRVMETYPGVKFDITPGWEMYAGFSKDIDRWHDFFVKYSDRIIYGTDSTDGMGRQQSDGSIDYSDEIDLNNVVAFALTRSHDEYDMPYFHKTVRGLALDADAIAKISGGNFVRYFGAQPKKVDRQLTGSVAEELLAKFKDRPEAALFTAELKKLLSEL